MRASIVKGQGCGLLVFHAILKEGAHIGNLDGTASGRQRGKHLAPVALGVEPLVQNRHHPPVVARSQQPPDALLQAQDRLWQQIFTEPVGACRFHFADAGLVHWVVGGVERELVNRDERKRLAYYIHTLPEALETEEDGAGLLAELAQHLDARDVASLHDE